MDVKEKEIIEVALDDIIPNRFQPRLSFDEQGLNELADSIRQHGIIQPLVLRKIGDKYEIIAGERRYKASYIAGLTKVPAVIINLNDNESAEVAIVENIQRKDLSPIEEAKSYQKLLDRGYLTQDQLASRMGKAQATVSNKLRLLNLADEVQEALLNNRISERHARSLLRIEDKEKQKELLSEIINKKLNVRETENLISKSLSSNEDEFIQINNLQPKQVEEVSNIFEFPKMVNNNIESEPFNLDEIDMLLKNTSSFINSIPEPEEDIEIMSDYLDQVITPIDVKDNIEYSIEKIEKVVEEIRQKGIDIRLEKYDFDSLYQFVIKVSRDED